MKWNGKTQQKATVVSVAGDADHSPTHRKQTALLFAKE